MRKKPLWKDILLLIGTGIAAAGLFFLPPVPVLRWNGEVVFQIGKLYGILLGYILLLAGVWLPGILPVYGKGKILLHGFGWILIWGGLVLLTGFLLQNETAIDEKVMLIVVLLLWPLIHGTIQYFLCRKRTWFPVRCIPVYICVLELLFTVYVYYDPLDLFGGWDELGALFTCIVTVPPAGAVLLAWLVWCVESAVRRRKVQETE